MSDRIFSPCNMSDFLTLDRIFFPCNMSDFLTWARDKYYMEFQKQIASPIPWIGMYIAAASLVCALSMASDVFRALWRKKFWFPCKYFTLNATSLTLLAVAMKLPVDLTTPMWGYWDKLAKLSGTILMTNVMGNFMTSLGSMDGKELLLNITAAAILVITIIVDVSIQIHTHVVDYADLWAEEIVTTVFMFFMLLTLCFSALTAPTTKKYLEVKYYQRYKTTLDEELLGKGKLTTDKLELAVKKLWLMAETSSPQFVMARSVTCTTSGAICLLNSLILIEACIRLRPGNHAFDYVYSSSDYGWSTMWILVIQSIGVAVGTIAPLMRWFMAVSFKCCEKGSRNCKDEFKIEAYWTEKLVEWKKSPLPLRIGNRKSRKLLQTTKNLIMNFLIMVQIVIVKISKAILLISVTLANPILSCFYQIKRLKMEHMSKSGASNNRSKQQSEHDTELDLGRYILLLEGEAELPKKSLARIFYEVDQLIQKGKSQKPKNLIKLLAKSSSFGGVKDFDCIQIPILHSEELPNDWTLPVVTLTSIAIALPNIETHVVDQLISSVTEGLRYAGLVEKSLDGERNFINIKNAANMVWVGVELYNQWLDKDLIKMSHEGKTSKEILQKLSDIAKENLTKFNRETKETLMENPVDRIINFFAANSMYRISQTLLLASEGGNNQTDEELFEQLSIMIADILSACLTNLPHYISTKCYNNVIEEREESIGHAARLLGETEDVLKILQNREIPSLDPDDAIYIDKWRTVINQETSHAFVSTLESTTTSTPSSEEHVMIEIGT